jgi:alkanesulfonate monooxygenase SsuD/methylene tetrahydromethanopterin reductase-like flavin-dependent oxidoreductase (luciferase family)
VKFAHFSHVWGKPGMTPHQRYEELWRELQVCDGLGYDYSFCVEHHFRPDESWISSPSVYIVGAAARTRNIRVGSMGYIVPLYHPLRLAEEIALVDQMIGGRMELGLVPGINAEYFCANRPRLNSSSTCGRPMAKRSRSRFMARFTTPTARCSRCSRYKSRIRRSG